MYLYLLSLLCIICQYSVSAITANNDSYNAFVNTPVCLNVLSNDIGTNLIVNSTISNFGFPKINYPPFFFQTSQSLSVVIEAEHYQGLNYRVGSAYSNLSDGVSWEITSSYAGSSGSAMIALPATGINIPNSNYGVALKYNVAFQTAKAYKAWIRGTTCTTCNTTLATQLVMQDAVGGFYTFVTSGSYVGNFSGNSWSWAGASVTVNVNGNEAVWPPLVKPIFVAMKQDGFVVDKIELNYQNTNSYGSSVGPSENPYFDCGSGLTYFPKYNWTGVDTFTYTITNGTSYSTGSVSVTVLAPSPSPSVTPSVTPTVSPSPVPSTSRTPTPTTTPLPSASSLPYNQVACPSQSPYRCSSNGQCVSDPELCVVSQNKTDNLSFMCANGSFVAYPALCSVSSCDCWNGDCGATSECPIVPGCPASLPKRCWNGCFEANISCTAFPPCELSMLCPDGQCRDYNSEECHPYDGCPLDAPIKCPSGKCVLELAQCLCGSGLYQCFDGSCAEMCAQPPSEYKPVKLYITVDTAVDSEVKLVAEGQSGVVGSLTVPAGAITTYGTSTAILEIAPVADSELRKVGDLNDVFSTVFELSSSTVQQINAELTVTMQIQLPVNKTLEDSCLAEFTSSGWLCASKLESVSSNPLTVQASIQKESTTYAVVSSPKQKDDSKKNKDIVKYGIIAGCGFAGLVILGGIAAMMIVYKSKAMKRERTKSEMRDMLESTRSTEVDLPAT